MLSRVLLLLLCSCAADRLASVPPYDHVADVGKVLEVNSSGSALQWSTASAVTGINAYALGATNAVVSGDLVAFSGTGGKQLVDSGISGNSSPSHSLLGVAGNTGPLSAISSSAANQVMVSNSGGTGILFGQVSLGSSAAVTGIVGVTNGGTNAITAASGFANLSPMTTKGDLISFSTIPGRLAVGASGSILTADPGQTLGVKWSSSTTQVAGTTTNDSASAGYVGELLGPITRLLSNATSLTTNTTVNVGTTTSITLTPGDWQISAMLGYTSTNAGTSITNIYGCVSKTSATLAGGDTTAVPTSCEACAGFASAANVWGLNQNQVVPLPSFRCTIATGTTQQIYLVGRATFTVSTIGIYGWMEARRMR